MVWMYVIAVAYPTWQAAYEKAMAGKVDGIDISDEARAIEFADMTVRTTQGSGGAQNLAMIQQSSELSKLVTMMYGYFNTTYNLQAEAYRQARAQGKNHVMAAVDPHVLAQTFWLTLIPALLSGLLLEAWPDDDDDDPEGWVIWSLIQIFTYATGQIVFVRDVAGSLIKGFDFGITPVESLGSGAADLGRTLYKSLENQGEFSDSTIKQTIRVAGMAKGVPGTHQIARGADYLIKFANDDLHHDPEHVGEFLKGLLLTGNRK